MLREPDSDDTVKLVPGQAMPGPAPAAAVARGRLGLLLAVAGGGALAAAFVAWMVWPRPAPVPMPAVVAPPVAALAPAVAPPGVVPPGPGSIAVAPAGVAPPAGTVSDSARSISASLGSALPGATTMPEPEFSFGMADEAQIRDNVATGMTVFRLAANPQIVVLDFASLRQQGMMLNRVAALIEKGGLPHDRVLTDAELDAAIRAGGDTVETFYYGHDYSAEALARFFATADRQGVRLDPEEETLRRLLQQLGWLVPGVQGGLISIPKVGADERVTYSARSTILHHELSHGQYFSDPAYAAFVHQFWMNDLTAAEQDAFRRFLGSEEYDTSLEDLTENEMQAYLMFTRDPEFFAPSRIDMTPARLAALQAKFLRGMPAGWLHDALASTPVVRVKATSSR